MSRGPLFEVGMVFLRHGLTSFGGPIAHLSYLHKEIVKKRGWVSEAEYAEIVALCQFLPGPASSQTVFALGLRRAGYPGALLASLFFLLPSALLMTLFGYGYSALRGAETIWWIQALKLAAVPIVADAVWIMGRNLCPDIPRWIGAALCVVAIFLPAWLLVSGVLGVSRSLSPTHPPHLTPRDLYS